MRKIFHILILTILCSLAYGQDTLTYRIGRIDSIAVTDLSSIQTFKVGGVGYYTPNLGVDTMKFTSVQPATLNQVSITFQTLAATDTVYLDWGDGSAVVKISKVTDQIVTSSYAANNTTYNIKLYGDLSKVKKFYAFNPTVASLNINDISDYMVNLDYLYLRDVTATGNKALPTKTTYLYLIGNNINWTYTGALSTDINYLYLYGNNINWTYTGALPTGITSLTLSGANIYWTYTGALPTKITSLTLGGNNINWTGLDIGNDGNITTLSLTNYREAKMSSADMVTLLTQMTNRTGKLPATVTINDYTDYALPPQDVNDAVEALRTEKSITTVTLGQ